MLVKQHVFSTPFLYCQVYFIKQYPIYTVLLCTHFFLPTQIYFTWKHLPSSPALIFKLFTIRVTRMKKLQSLQRYMTAQWCTIAQNYTKCPKLSTLPIVCLAHSPSLEMFSQPEPLLKGWAKIVLLLLNNPICWSQLCAHMHIWLRERISGKFISLSLSKYTLPFINFGLWNKDRQFRFISVEMKDVIKLGLNNVTYNSKLWNTMKPKEERKVLWREKLEIWGKQGYTLLRTHELKRE